MRNVLVLFVVIGTLAANVLLSYRLDEALKRVEASEAVTVELFVKVDQLETCAAQCDGVILERQNLIIQELRRLDFNQQTVIAIIAPSDEEPEETE